MTASTADSLHPPCPDPTAAARFLDFMSEAEPVTFQTFADKRSGAKLAQIRHGQLDEQLAALMDLNGRGAGVFWMVNYGDGKGRAAANVTGVRALFVDLDGAPISPVQACAMEPHAVIESSPGRFHAYWLVTGCALEDFGAWQKALAAKFAGDVTVHDLPRVMRLPGFVHQKGEPFTSRIVSLAPMQPYDLGELVGTLRLQREAPARRSQASAQVPADAPGQLVEGGRNAALARLAGKLRRDGLSATAIEGALLDTNRERCRPPLDDSEVAGIARSIGRYAAGSLEAQPARASPEPAPAVPPEWPDPILPGAARTPPIPADILPTWLGDMAGAIAASTQTPPALAVMSCLAILATVLQRRFEVSPRDGYTETLSLWGLGAAPSGARKTAVQGAALAPIVRWEKLERDRMRVEIARANAARAVAKKRIEHLLGAAAKAKTNDERELLRAEIQREEEGMPDEMRAPRLFTGDTTAERLQAMLVEHLERMAVHTDEGGIFGVMAGLYTGGQANLDVFLQAHAGSPLRVDRAGRSAHLDKPALSFGLLLQPGVLSEAAASRRFRDSGLLARFLYFMPASNVGTRDVRQHLPIPYEVRNAYETNLFRLLEGATDPVKAPIVLPLTDPALECWYQMAEGIEQHQGEGGRFESISDWTSKLPGAAARMAGLFELAEAGLEARSVGVASMERAVRLARLLIPHAQAAFGLLGTDATDVDAIAIVKWAQAGERAEFTRRECQKAMEGRFRNIERLQKALVRLEHQDVVREFKRHNKGAPATTAYRVNPKALSTNPALSP